LAGVNFGLGTNAEGHYFPTYTWITYLE